MTSSVETPGTPVQPKPLHAFHVMVKPRGSICNLDCQYCFYLKKEQLYPGGSFCMTDELLEDYTRQYIAAQRVPQVTFAWQGGEPTLMGLDFFRRAVALQAKYRSPGMTIRNALQTNGTLLDDDWGEFLRQHEFLVGLSLDGPRALHDAYRQDKGGQPTFDRVLRGAEFLKKHRVDFNTLTCVNAANAGHGLEVYRFLRDEVGSHFLQFIPIIERDHPQGYQDGARLTSRSIGGVQYGRFLIEIFDEWLRRDVGKIFVQLFDVALAGWSGQRPGLCIYEETCGEALAMEFNGDLYACDHFVEPRYLLGSLQETPLADLAASPRQRAFGLAKRDALPRYCRECDVRFICNGGCPKDRVLRAPDGQPGLNALCAGLRAFFTYADPPMKIMAALLRQGRAPAEAMRIFASQPPLNELPEGAPCPCGSRRTVEACHRAAAGYTPIGHTAPPPSILPDARRRRRH